MSTKTKTKNNNTETKILRELKKLPLDMVRTIYKKYLKEQFKTLKKELKEVTNPNIQEGTRAWNFHRQSAARTNETRKMRNLATQLQEMKEKQKRKEISKKNYIRFHKKMVQNYPNISRYSKMTFMKPRRLNNNNNN